MTKHFNYPSINLEAIRAWQSAGLRVYMRRVKGGYVVRVEGQ